MMGGSAIPNNYYDFPAVAEAVARSQHRDRIGGLWEEIGKLQIDFLRRQGLVPSSRLVDIGCGCLRGGIHFVEFLEAGNYYGTDINQPLLDAGYDVELKQKYLQGKLPRANLLCDGEFRFERFATRFHLALAQSVFTHLPGNHLQLCLARLAPRMEADGSFFATFFIVPDEHPFGVPFDHPGGIRSFDHQDPYHYRAWQIHNLCDNFPWTAEIIGEWGHPRGQQMVRFRLNRPVEAAPEGEAPQLRSLTVDDAAKLAPGADHYRAYVGPPDRYDFMSASQFALLFALGLRDQHRVLDFGCGSLRLGRLLIPFLRPERYFGIDPNRWLIAEAIRRELGGSAVRVKRPAFAFNDDFRCGAFGVKFDYIVAQSILTHGGSDIAELLLGEMGASLAETGRIAFSVIESSVADEKPDRSDWVYPDCVRYGGAALAELCGKAGLLCRRIPWYHPGATWYVAARDAAHLPSDQEMALLRGAVLFDSQFEDSRIL